ncbi:MAG: hypothetical protein ACK59W_06790 [Pseudanabaena sp.]
MDRKRGWISLNENTYENMLTRSDYSYRLKREWRRFAPPLSFWFYGALYCVKIQLIANKWRQPNNYYAQA